MSWFGIISAVVSFEDTSSVQVTVGLPATPSPLLTLIPVPAVIVRLVKVSAAVSTRMPAVESSAARAVRVASDDCFVSA
ncbi:hypothetical protein [uncultured Flavobacterium sp.]|uniref:hypothetical protein n=1 Tax=uncultured Flavobacterium sp. TaxID=165435 RepID=UPI00259425D0|nr:hypothetical protein [uncultured Flavobacterium sp.]